MSQYMIAKWNGVVAPDDTVYHLGDIAFINDPFLLKGLIDRLNGKIIMTIGNHDRMTVAKYAQAGITAYREPIVYKDEYLLSHRPMFGDNLRGYAKNVHGHTHNNPDTPTDRLHVCVSVELIDYTPVTIEEIERRFNAKRD